VSNARRHILATLAILGLAACGSSVGPASAHSLVHVSASHRVAVHTTAGARSRNACLARARAAHSRPAAHRCPSVSAPAPRRKISAPASPPPTVAPIPVASATQAASIASALATSCQNTELKPEPANLLLVRAAVLCLINRVRAQHGESPLLVNPELERAAEEHGGELVADDYFAHVAPNGTTPVDRARATGYIPGPRVGYVIGENLAWGTLNLSTPQSIVAAWVASPGHLANILEAQYRDTGVGVTPAAPSSLGGGQQGATYTQEFGVIIH
jgi:uncharacterized protein YkwD